MSEERNTFRQVYRELSPGTKLQVEDLKDEADMLLSLFPSVHTREGAIAKTKLQEAVMWAVRGLTE